MPNDNDVFGLNDASIHEGHLQGILTWFSIERAVMINHTWTPERCLVKFKMCHSKWCNKIGNQTFSYRFIVAATMVKQEGHDGPVTLTWAT